MTDNKAWYCGVRNQDPHVFLTWTPSKLPKFGDYEWRIHAAIVVVHETSAQHYSRQHASPDSTLPPSTPRAVLVLQNKPTPSAEYGMSELPNGRVETHDLDVEDALRRIINTTTGLHFDQILSSLTPIQVFDSREDFAGQVNLRFVVSVTEITSLDDCANTSISFQSHRWIYESDTGYTEVHLPMKYSQQKLINTAFDTYCFECRDTMEYLNMASTDLLFTDRFNYVVCAAVVRIEADTLTPQILLIERGEHKLGAGNWELPGGRIYNDAATIQDRLCGKILSETGLSVSNILVGTRKKPYAFPSRRHFAAGMGMVNLAYLVKVDDTEVVKLNEDYSDWKWSGTMAEAKKMKMTFAGLKTVREALDAVAEGFRAGSDV